jgi:hypothetical protein
VYDRFRIGPSVELMSALLKVATKRFVVVNFTIEYYGNGAVFIVQGLMTAFDVDDAQAAHAQSDFSIHENAGVVGTAMEDRLTHCRKTRPNWIGRVSGPVVEPHNSAHQRQFSLLD